MCSGLGLSEMNGMYEMKCTMSRNEEEEEDEEQDEQYECAMNVFREFWWQEICVK